MFGEISSSYGELSPEQKQTLASFLADRNEYLTLQVRLNELRIQVLNNPTPAAEEQLQDFASAVVAPVRDRLSQQVLDLVGESVNVDKIMQMLPLLLLTMAQSVNIPMLLTVINLDPDMIEKLIGSASDYFKSGM